MATIKQSISRPINADLTGVKAIVNEAADGIQAVPSELVIKSSDDSTFTQISDGSPMPVKVMGGIATNITVSSGNVKDAWDGSVDITKTFSGPRTGLLIANDGATDLTVTLGSLILTVKSGEVLDELFDPFTSVTITTTSAYRAWTRG